MKKIAFYFTCVLFTSISFCNVPSLKQLSWNALLNGSDWSETSINSINDIISKLPLKDFDFRGHTLIGLTFKNDSLKDVDFSGCHFYGVTFEKVSFDKELFKEATFEKCTFIDVDFGAFFPDYKELTAVDRYYYKETLYEFTNVKKLNEIKLKYGNKYPICFKLCTFKNINFSTKSLYNVDFHNCDLINVNFNRADLTKTNFDESKFTQVNLSGALLEENLRFNSTWQPRDLINKLACSKSKYINNLLGAMHIYLYDEDLSTIGLVESCLKNVIITNTKLKACSFEKANLKNAQFINCGLSDKRLSRLCLDGVNLENATISNTKLNNSSFIRANLKNAQFINCDLSDVSFYQACLENTVFHDCILDRAYLSKTTLRGTSFNQCSMKSVQVEQTQFIDVVLNGNDLININFDKAHFTNSTLNGLELSDKFELKNMSTLAKKYPLMPQ